MNKRERTRQQQIEEEACAGAAAYECCLACVCVCSERAREVKGRPSAGVPGGERRRAVASS